MSELQVFNNAEFGSVSSLTINGEPYFVGRDVAKILGYANPNDALAKRVDEEDKGVAKCDTLGGIQELTVINESGLYSLILSSKIPSANRFKRWVTSEVLPAIRKHGVFAMDDIVNNTDALIEALQAFKAERLQRMALEEENAVQKQQLVEMKPKASYYDVVLNSPDLVSITEIAKDYGWSAQKMNEYLHVHGIQFKQGGCRLPSFGLYLFAVCRGYREKYLQGKSVFQIRSGEEIYSDRAASSLSAISE